MVESTLSQKAAEARARMIQSQASRQPGSNPVAVSAPKAKKEPRNPRDFSFFSAKSAMDVHDALKDLRNEGYKQGATAVGMLLLSGAALYYQQYIIALPFGALFGWHWAQHKDRFDKFSKRSQRPALTPDMLLLYDNSKPIPFEGLHKRLDLPVPFKGVFKF